MRITDIYIQGYGIFQDCCLQNIPAGLNIFLGDNEAGKSTCLGFIRDVLFGAPDGRSRERTYYPLRGGRWGGSLGLTCDSWERILVERSPGARGGKLTLTSNQGQNLHPEILNRILGGVTREVFKNVYAFSLSELQTLETLNSDRVRDAIYSAGLGAGLSSLPEALKDLENRKEKLFKVRGQNQTINALLSKIEDVRAQLRQASHDLQDYEQAEQELESLNEAGQNLKQTISSLQGRLYQLKSMHSRWEEWIDYLEQSRQLAQLPPVENFPEQGLQQFEQLRNKLDNDQERRLHLAQEIQNLQERLQGLAADWKVLNQEQNIQALTEDKSSFAQADAELLRLQPEIDAARENIQALLRRLGSGWDKHSVLSFDCSLQVKEKMDYFDQSLRELQHKVDKAAHNLDSRDQELARTKQALQQAEHELAAWGSPDNCGHQELSARLKRDRDRFAQALEELPIRRNQKEHSLHEVQRILAEIDPSWTQKDLQRLDTSLQQRERTENYDQELKTLDREVLRLEQELSASRETENELQQKYNQLQQSLQDLQKTSFQSLDQLRDTKQALKELQQTNTQIENIQVRLRALQDRLYSLQREYHALPALSRHSRFWPAAAAVSFAGGALMLTLPFGGYTSWTIALWSGLILGLAGVFCSIVSYQEKQRLVRRNQDLTQQQDSLLKEQQSLEQELHQVQLEQSALEQKAAQLQDQLQLQNGADLDAFDVQLDQDRETLLRRQSLQQELQNTAAALDKALQKSKDLHQKYTENLQAREHILAAWQQELTSLGLQPGLQPPAVLRILDRAENAKSELNRLRETKSRVQSLQDFIQEYARQAAALPQARDLPLEQSEQILSAVDRHLEHQQQEQDRLKNRKLAARERDRLAEEYALKEKSRDQARLELTQAEQDLQECQQSWRNWLQESGLHLDLTPALAREALAHIEQAQNLLTEQKRLADKQEQNHNLVQDFAKRVRSLARELNRPEPTRQNLLHFVQTLARELDNNKGIAERRQGLQEQLQEKQNTLQGLDALITQRQQELHDLLSQVEARDEQEFQDMGRILEQTSQLQENLQNLAGSLKRGSGYSNLQQAIELYSAWNKEQLTAEIHSLEQDIEEKEKRRQEISSRIGELQAKRENLASREDVSRLRQEEESLKEDLQQAALSWSRYTLALHLLRQAKSRYEQEQQPQVLRTAGRFLARITGGAYTGIYAPLGQSQVFALDDTGQTREPEELSRGTAEQLYLALRFGYVENAAEHGERLPIIMDDILVNFDPRRAQNAAAAIHELAQKNQILYFTCHPQTLSYLQQASTQTAVYEMKAGCVQRKQ